MLIGNRPLWGHCLAPFLKLHHKLLKQGAVTTDHLMILRIFCVFALTHWRSCNFSVTCFLTFSLSCFLTLSCFLLHRFCCLTFFHGRLTLAVVLLSHMVTIFASQSLAFLLSLAFHFPLFAVLLSHMVNLFASQSLAFSNSLAFCFTLSAVLLSHIDDLSLSQFFSFLLSQFLAVLLSHALYIILEKQSSGTFACIFQVRIHQSSKKLVR